MEELENKLKEVLDSMNETFEYEIQTNDEEVVDTIQIKKLKNNGEEFIKNFVSLFGPLINTVHKGQKEIVFEEETGLIIKTLE